MKRYGSVLFLIGFLFLFSAAAGPWASGHEKMTVVDLGQRTVEVSQNPEKIICLMAGVRQRLEYSDVPEPLRGLGVTMIVTGLMAVAFLGFSGMARIQ